MSCCKSSKSTPSMSMSVVATSSLPGDRRNTAASSPGPTMSRSCCGNLPHSQRTKSRSIPAFCQLPESVSSVLIRGRLPQLAFADYSGLSIRTPTLRKTL
jgi:hypothetical protein